MSYNDQIPDQQGAIKSSEIFTDHQLQIIKNNVGDTVLATLEGMMKPVSDAIRYNNFLLRSDGQVFWENSLGVTKIKFDSDAKANNIILTLYVMDESAVSRTVEVRVNGTTGANSLTAFNEIILNANELVYLEISRAELLAATSGVPATTPGQLVLENGITGGSTASGKRVLKTSLSGVAGMPALLAEMNSLTQSNSQTVNIPLAARYDWSDGLTTFPDIWWIPHGIRWPSNVRSVLGAVVVSGFEALPNFFVRSELELIQALTSLNSDGGIITPTQSFTITTPITVPQNVTILGRSNRADGINNAKITVAAGAGFTLQAGAGLKNLGLIVASGFGASGTSNVVNMTGARSFVIDCQFRVTSTTVSPNLNNTRCIQVFTDRVKIDGNYFYNPTTAGATAVYYVSGNTNHLVTFSQVLNVTEAAYQDRGRSVGVRSDYGMIPVGGIIPWLGASYINGSNSTPNFLVGGSGVANLTTYLGDGWVICDGRALPTDSVLRTGGNTFTPNLTDRYLRGATTYGAALGSDNYTTNGATASFSSAAANSGLDMFASSSISNVNHSHPFPHVHQWAFYFGSPASAWALTSPNNTGVGRWRVSPTTPPGLNGAVQASELSGNGGGNRFVWTGIPSGERWTSGPADASGNFRNNTENPNWEWFGGPQVITNLTINNQGSVSASALNSAQGNHTHTISAITPSYLSVIYIMRVK